MPPIVPWHSVRQLSSLKSKCCEEAFCSSKTGERLHGTPIFSYLDEPQEWFVIIQGSTITVTGWAFSVAGIESITASIDDGHRLPIHYGDPRPDVGELYGLHATNSGFSGKATSDGLGDGRHSLKVLISTPDGSRCEFTRQIVLTPRRSHAGEAPEVNDLYRIWLNEHLPGEQVLRAWRQQAEELPYKPLFTIVPPPGHLSPSPAFLTSLSNQIYDHWELWLPNALAPYDALRTSRSDTLGLHSGAPSQSSTFSCTWNDAVMHASGDFLVRIDSDGMLSPTALLFFALLLNARQTITLIYADNDCIDVTGDRWDPFFKPDWSPDLLLSMNYLAPLYIYRRSLLQELSGVREGLSDPAESYDLALRFTENGGEVHHVPEILFSKCASRDLGLNESSPTADGESGVRSVLEEALQRRRQSATIQPGHLRGRWRVRYTPRGDPRVTLVVPTGGRLEYLGPFLASLFRVTTYAHFNLLIVDNSDGTAVQELCDEVKREHSHLDYVRFSLKPFDYSAICNYALRLIDAPYVILLNDDTSVLTPNWIEAMLEHATRPEVGVVGAKLLFPDNSIQHAGVILGPYENCGHAFRNLPDHCHGYFGLHHTVRNCSAVTFACAMMRRAVYDEIGGLNTMLRVAFQDVDMCLRLRERGYWVVYTPYAVLYHHESATKTTLVEPGEHGYMTRRWGQMISRDPFYNPNLTRANVDYSLKWDN